MKKRSVTILGDSYSTFKDCLPEGNYVYYPREGIENVKSPEDTWWHQLIEKRQMELLLNDSSSGTTVSTRVREQHKTADAFICRMKKSLSKRGVDGKKPDLILLFGGTNDSWIGNEAGELQFKNWSEDDLKRVLPAYCYMLDYVKKHNPKAQIVSVINCDLREDIMTGIAAACAHYDVTSVQLHDISKITGHPDAKGMQQICDQVDAALGERLEVNFFKQHSLETCGISCLMMAMKHFGRVKDMSVALEESLYKIYGCRATKGTLGAGIAYALCKNGLDATLVHESEMLLDNKDGYYAPELHAALLAEHLDWIQKARELKAYQAESERLREQYGSVSKTQHRGSICVEAGRKITWEQMRKEIDRGRLLIVQCFIEGNADGMHDHVMHWILLYGYEGKYMLGYDPLCDDELEARLKLRRDELSAYMQTPFGGAYIAVGMPET